MTLDAPRRQTLLKTLRGKSFRRAMKAIAELRTGDDPTLVDAIGADQTVDAQRGAQHHIARIVVAQGLRGLVREWPTPADPKWRAELVSEIDQSLDLWIDEATVDLLLAALEDESREVRAKAVWALVAVLREIPAQERRTARADSHRRAIGARDALRGWMTPARRSRAARALVAMLEQQRDAPEDVLPQIDEVRERIIDTWASSHAFWWCQPSLGHDVGTFLDEAALAKIKVRIASVTRASPARSVTVCGRRPEPSTRVCSTRAID